MSCCGGWRRRKNATNGPDAPMPSAEPLTRPAEAVGPAGQPSLRLPRLEAAAAARRKRLHNTHLPEANRGAPVRTAQLSPLDANRTASCETQATEKTLILEENMTLD